MILKPNPKIKSAHQILNYPEMLHETGSIGFLEKMIIGNLIAISRPKLIIETGLFKGYTHLFMTEFIALNRLPECRIVSFDFPEVVNYLKSENEFFRDGRQGELISGRLPDSLEKFFDENPQQVDFAVIDGDHSYKGVIKDLKTIVPKLKPGGYIFCHDYRPHDAKYAGTTTAIDQFCLMNGLDYLPLVGGSEGDEASVWGAALLRKPDKGRSRTKRMLSSINQSVKSLFLGLMSRSRGPQ